MLSTCLWNYCTRPSLLFAACTFTAAPLLSSNNPHMLWIINHFFSLPSSINIFINSAVDLVPVTGGTTGDLLELEAYVYRGDLLGKSTLISHQSELSCHRSRASRDEFECLTGQHVAVGVSVVQRVKVFLQDVLCNLQIKQMVSVLFFFN